MSSGDRKSHAPAKPNAKTRSVIQKATKHLEALRELISKDVKTPIGDTALEFVWFGYPWYKPNESSVAALVDGEIYSEDRIGGFEHGTAFTVAYARTSLQGQSALVAYILDNTKRMTQKQIEKLEEAEEAAEEAASEARSSSSSSSSSSKKRKTREGGAQLSPSSRPIPIPVPMQWNSSQFAPMWVAPSLWRSQRHG